MTLKVTLLLTSVLFQNSLSTVIVDPNSYQYEVGSLIPNNGYISYPDANPLMYPITPNIQRIPQIPEQRSIRQLQPLPPKVPTDTSLVSNNVNSEINEIIESLNQLTENRMTENQDSRAAERDDFELYHRSSPGYPVSPPNYGPWSPSSPPYEVSPQKHDPHAKLSLLKPELLLKPIATKAAGKLSGLIELVLALFGTSGGVELNGFKDIVINGIVRPLLLAKGGLKSLISKLSIPLISLLLINVEVLITIWWLWEEDCPQPVYHHPTYAHHPKPAYHEPSYPPSYNYNNPPYNPY